MPWVKRTSQSYRFYWILAAVASVIVGVSAGYSWWGESASVVSIVEQELANSRAQVRMLDRRVKALETKLGIDSENAAAESDPSVKAY
ncbi:MAG TPA: hypothetical protein VEI95_08555 [Acidobacteriota bacterium]|nr:hypothetical protein [Acidobacteriota bacterium]